MDWEGREDSYQRDKLSVVLPQDMKDKRYRICLFLPLDLNREWFSETDSAPTSSSWGKRGGKSVGKSGIVCSISGFGSF